ncbi:hypothetical protein PPERSA_09763 [Pseudocohnilembus persalinus]|uniref:Uncharacterized protein n=1 Tax=Pseudocohnilembus persalinus TaxID=266149 RepID=A0A0V0QTV6_PSEPJ|nr:hypothetical protein PPERSA_09763 [Pseudocohnilembus persalinus]|eukprot:KRX05623.1 hypothetical protein PPERSA_09763 [Pseudocohnilembus persalinus]
MSYQTRQIQPTPSYLEEVNYSTVIDIDQKLEELQRQAQLMEQQYGFNKDMLEQEEEEQAKKVPPKMTSPVKQLNNSYSVNNTISAYNKNQSHIKQNTNEKFANKHQSQKKVSFKANNNISDKKQRTSQNNLSNLKNKSQNQSILDKTDQSFQKQKTQILNYGPNESRYRNLPAVKNVDMPIIKNKNEPKISNKWKTITQEKPDPFKFFDKDLFKPVFIDKSDFITNGNLANDFSLFNDRIGKYALEI